MKKAFLVIATLLLVACGSAATQENYDQISVGQDFDEVATILGKPDVCNSSIGGLEDCRWGDEERYIKVKFVNKKVMLRSAKGLK